MKLIHLSDLHLGKKVNEISMINDQRHILNQILNIIDREKPDGIVIAGDVYDRTVPPVEAMEMLESFFYALAAGRHRLFVISGNHDSAERLSFGGRLMDMSGIHIAPAYRGEASLYTLSDDYGELDIYLLPFVKPSVVKHALGNQGDLEINSYTDALKAAVKQMQLDKDRRKVLVAHQFITGAQRCDSEDISIGGLDNADASVFEDFDYVALGHLHGPQTLGLKKNIRYCGTPLKYSFSEVNHEKSLTVVEIGEKGSEPQIRTVKLEPLHDWVEVRETFDRATSREFLNRTDTDAYVKVTLLDEDDVPDAFARLRTCYPNLMGIEYDNRRTRNEKQLAGGPKAEEKTEMELFEELFEIQNNRQMNDEQKAFAEKMIVQLKESTEGGAER